MTKEELSSFITDKFGDNQAEFVRKFNEASKSNLTTSYLNRQLKGRVSLEKGGYGAAYELFKKVPKPQKAEVINYSCKAAIKHFKTNKKFPKKEICYWLFYGINSSPKPEIIFDGKINNLVDFFLWRRAFVLYSTTANNGRSDFG